MADSLRTDPRHIRASRRCLQPPRVRVQQPGQEAFHPASEQDVLTALDALGQETYYGLEEVRLAPVPSGPRSTALPFGPYTAPGVIRLFAKPVPPWSLPGLLPAAQAQRLEAWGAAVKVPPAGLQTLVEWPAGALRRFFLLDVLPHEIGHHVLQHVRRKARVRAARTADHEAFARDFARRHRAALAAALCLECPGG